MKKAGRPGQSPWWEVAKQYQSAYHQFMEQRRRQVFVGTSFSPGEMEFAGSKALSISS
jgi:hypothetical protein